MLSLSTPICVALNGITLFRAFQRTFLGPLRRHLKGAAVEALVLRERAFLLALVALTVVLGVAPARLIAIHAPVVERVLHDVAHGAQARLAAAANRRSIDADGRAPRRDGRPSP